MKTCNTALLLATVVLFNILNLHPISVAGVPLGDEVSLDNIAQLVAVRNARSLPIVGAAVPVADGVNAVAVPDAADTLRKKRSLTDGLVPLNVDILPIGTAQRKKRSPPNVSATVYIEIPINETAQRKRRSLPNVDTLPIDVAPQSLV